MEEYFLPYFKDLILPVPLYKVQREHDMNRRLRARGSLKMFGSLNPKGFYLVTLGSYHSIFVKIDSE